MKILPLAFDMTTPKGAVGWTDIATNAFVAPSTEHGRLMMLRTGTTPTLCCDPDTIKKGHRRVLESRFLLDSPAIAQFMGTLYMNQPPFNAGMHMNDVYDSLLSLAWPLEANTRDLIDTRKAHTQTWMSQAGLWTIPKAPMIDADTWAFGYSRLAMALKANVVPSANTPSGTVSVVVAFTPELDETSSAHLRLHVYRDLVRHIGFSYVAGTNARTQWKLPDDLDILAPLHMGKIVYPSRP